MDKLIYLSHTRPDIAYVVSLISQFMHNLSNDHMNVVIQILRYLKSSPGRGLMFRKYGHLNMEGYSDAAGQEAQIGSQYLDILLL